MIIQLAVLLDYPYFNENFEMTEIDLSKQQALYADPRAIQQINFTSNFTSLLTKQKKLS